MICFSGDTTRLEDFVVENLVNLEQILYYISNQMERPLYKLLEFQLHFLDQGPYHSLHDTSRIIFNEDTKTGQVHII